MVLDGAGARRGPAPSTAALMTELSLAADVIERRLDTASSTAWRLYSSVNDRR